MDGLVTLFCLVDDFCKIFEPTWAARLIRDGQRKRLRAAASVPNGAVGIVRIAQWPMQRSFYAKLTPGNVDDRKPVLDLCDGLFSKLYGDKGYTARWLTTFLQEQGIELITRLNKNMRPIERTPFDLAMLRQRGLIETVSMN